MGAAREGHNLFHPYGRKHVWGYIKRNRTARGIYWSDTFMPIWCAVVGHRPYNCSDEHEPPEMACKRCHQYLPKSA